MPPTIFKTGTPMQMRVVEVYAKTGSQKLTAHELGISEQTVKNHLSALYARLGVESGILQALNALGWIRVPTQTGTAPCGWISYCGRPDGHRGQHGGWRPFIRVPEEE